MNKREFLSRGGAGVLASSSALALTGMAPSPARARHDPAASPTRGHTFESWLGRTGEAFEAHTALGRSVTLTLTRVSQSDRKPSPSPSSTGLSQFDLVFTGARHLPLQEGLQTLQSVSHGPVALHLLPHRQVDGMRYVAHFSLLA